jgi:hypothetical protein
MMKAILDLGYLVACYMIATTTRHSPQGTVKEQVDQLVKQKLWRPAMMMARLVLERSVTRYIEQCPHLRPTQQLKFAIKLAKDEGLDKARSNRAGYIADKLNAAVHGRKLPHSYNAAAWIGEAIELADWYHAESKRLRNQDREQRAKSILPGLTREVSLELVGRLRAPLVHHLPRNTVTAWPSE